MSLQLAAQHLASRGRGDDSVLVHMTPGEVNKLQDLAMAHGGSLTINPETGLPEAGFLSSILPTVLGLGATVLSGGAITPLMAGLGIGALQTVRTGDIGKGLMAGLGAYGGANIGVGLGAMGADQAAVAAYGAQAAAGEEAAQIAAAQARQEALKATGFDALKNIGAGAEAAFSSPSKFITAMGGAQPALKAAGMALGPIAAAQDIQSRMPKTVTQMTSPTARITPYRIDRSGNIASAGSYTPEEFAKMGGFSNLYNQPPGGAEGGVTPFADGGNVVAPSGMLDFAQRSEPVVRMAVGGPVLPSDIGTYTPEQKADLYNQFLSQGFNDAAIRQAAGQQTDTDWQTLQNLAAQRGSPAVSGAERAVLTTPNWQSLSGQTGLAGLSSNIQNFFETNPTVDYGDISQAAQQYGVDTQDIIRALETGGGSGAMQTVTTSPEWKSRSGQTGLEGLSSNINMWFRENPQATESDIRNAMDFWKLNDADIIRATGKTVSELGYKPPKPPVVDTTGPNVTFGGDTITPTYTPPQPQVTLAEPFQPTAPTMSEVKTAYEQGGGSTKMPTITDIRPDQRTFSQNEAFSLVKGYLQSNPNAPYRDVLSFAMSRGIPEMQTRAAYNEFRFSGMSGGTQQAYDYLMGRGAYPTKPYVPGGGPIMRSYREVMGLPTGYEGLRPVNLTGGQSTTPSDQEEPSVMQPSSFRPSTTKTSGISAIPTVDKLRSTFDTSIFNKTPQEKAAYYNSLLNAGYDDAAIREAINAPLDENWMMLRQIAAGLKGKANGGPISAAGGRLMNIAAAAASEGGHLGSYSDGGRLLRGPGDGVSDSIPAVIGNKQPARLADGEFVVPARIVSELGNGSTEAGARKLYAMMDRVQAARKKSIGKGKVAKNSRADKYLPA